MQSNQEIILRRLHINSAPSSFLNSTPPCAPPQSGTPQESVQPPTALPVEGVNESNCLESTEINKSQLHSVDQVLGRRKATTSNVGKLAIVLARECVFGVSVMKRCTPLGAEKLPGLTVHELQWLKQLILECFPEFWGNVQEYEKIWKNVSLHWNIIVVACDESNPYCSSYQHSPVVSSIVYTLPSGLFPSPV